MAGGREGKEEEREIRKGGGEREGKWRDIKSANPCTFCLPLLLLASISLYSISLFCNAVIKTKKTQTDIGDKIHPIKAHAPKLTEVTPHDAVSYSYRVKPPQVLSMSTKATPIKPSTFRIRLGFWEKNKSKSKCLNVILTWNWGKDLQSKAAESTQPLLDLINLFIGSNSGSEVIAVASQRMFRTFCYGVCMSQVFSGSCSFTHYQKKKVISLHLGRV